MKKNFILVNLIFLFVIPLKLYSKVYFQKDIFKSEIKLASLLKEYGYYKKSLKHYKRLTKSNHSVSLFIDLGVLYKKTGEISKAEKIIKDAIREKPENQELINALGDIYFEEENYEKAREYLIKIKNNKKAVNRLAVLENRNNNYQSAIKYYKILVEKYNDEFQRVNLAILYQKINDIENAENQLLLFYKNSKDKYYAIRYLIRFYKKYNKKEELKKFIESLKLKRKKKKKMRPLLKSRR